MIHLNNKKIKFQFISGILAVLLFTSCKPDKVSEPVKMYTNYFPHETGYWLIYDVDSTKWDDFTGEQRQYSFQIMELFESTFTDNEGKQAIRIERYKRSNDTLSWTIQDVWQLNVEQNSVQKVEENLRYVKLIFPVKLNSLWNGNSYNNLQQEIYTYKSVHQPMSVNSLSFDSTLTVQQAKSANLLNETDKYEQYAIGVGLVSKYYKDITKNIITGQIEKGVEYTYTIKEFKH